jgi:hypothetical protein
MHTKMTEREETISRQEVLLQELRQQVQNYQEDLSALNSEGAKISNSSERDLLNQVA